MIGHKTLPATVVVVVVGVDDDDDDIKAVVVVPRNDRHVSMTRKEREGRSLLNKFMVKRDKNVLILLSTNGSVGLSSGLCHRRFSVMEARLVMKSNQVEDAY
jgi:hypothetical protein